MIRPLMLAGVCAALACGGAASAQPAPAPGEDGRDAGHQGDRRRPAREQVFISPSGEPFRAPMDQPYPVVQWFQRADADHDGVLTFEEFKADAMAFFDKLDTDHDGVIDGFETSDYEQKVAPEIIPRIARDDEEDAPPKAERGRSARGGFWKGGGDRALAGGLGRLQGAAPYSLLNEPEPVRAADANFDQRITRAEWLAATRQRFQLLDKKGDGRVTLADLPKTPAQQLAERARDGRDKAGRDRRSDGGR
ncbi:MAG: EF-hand domain-containing protein [Caulobacteraceae bacterium]|nr:EF-hand domain-containing protein [Caulobacteraceae bacterium]